MKDYKKQFEEDNGIYFRPDLEGAMDQLARASKLWLDGKITHANFIAYAQNVTEVRSSVGALDESQRQPSYLESTKREAPTR